SVFVPLMLATAVATVASILITGIYQRLKFDRVLIAWLGTIITAIFLFVLVYFSNCLLRKIFRCLLY
ncbi:hypothetical protein, partial [Sediminibacterium salmoneum]|uniref:hypothetical protein n=1 Tax=Sediminibacterium salmoneum TaxID=426421 RepID=UPI001C11DBDE